MNSTIRYLGAALTVLLISGAVSSQAETLQDAVGHMLLTNPELRSIGYNRLARNEEVKQAEAGYGPVFDLSSSIGVLKEDHPIEDSLWPQSTKLSLQQNVFRGFAELLANRLEAVVTL